MYREKMTATKVPIDLRGLCQGDKLISNLN